jgi:hypothetical protein
MGVGASLNCSIYYNFLRELPRNAFNAKFVKITFYALGGRSGEPS